MATKFSKIVRMFAAAALVAIGAIGIGSSASAESPDGWKATGGETKVFQANREDGRTVGIYARPAVKGSDTGMLVRVTLTGFSDKRLALREGDLPELFDGYKDHGKSWIRDILRKIRNLILDALKSALKAVVKDLEKLAGRELKHAALLVFKAAGDVETKTAQAVAANLQADGADAIEARADAVIAAAKAGGDLTQRFVAANGQTVQNATIKVRGGVVRAIHSSLINSGAK